MGVGIAKPPPAPPAAKAIDILSKLVPVIGVVKSEKP